MPQSSETAHAIGREEPPWPSLHACIAPVNGSIEPPTGCSCRKGQPPENSSSALGAVRAGCVQPGSSLTPKREMIAGTPGWDSPAKARRAVFAWITRYNTRRRHSTCGQVSPITYENTHTLPTLQTAA